MNKLLFKISLTIATMCACLAAEAQGNADMFAWAKTIQLDDRTMSGGGVAIVTNSPADIHGFGGIAKLDITCIPLTTGTITTLNLQGSSDLTNWTSYTTCAAATAATVIYTNTAFGGVITATNTENKAGTLTTPTAFTAGFATPFLNPALFTNTESALILTTNAVTTIGFNVDDQARYIRLVYSNTGAATNTAVSAVLTTGGR